VEKPIRNIAIIGAGPAGLIAAERLAGAGHRGTIYERMASPARKVLLAGRGGLNLTHSEPLDRFMARYGAADRIPPLIEAFPPRALVEWAESLGQPTFVGTSGRVFPKAMKASPLLRAWLRRLEGQGVSFRTRAEWRGGGGAGGGGGGGGAPRGGAGRSSRSVGSTLPHSAPPMSDSRSLGRHCSPSASPEHH